VRTGPTRHDDPGRPSRRRTIARCSPCAPCGPRPAENGRVTFAPKTETTGAPKPEPVASNRGRTLATLAQPVAPARPAPASARPQVRSVRQRSRSGRRSDPRRRGVLQTMGGPRNRRNGLRPRRSPIPAKAPDAGAPSRQHPQVQQPAARISPKESGRAASGRGAPRPSIQPAQKPARRPSARTRTTGQPRIRRPLHPTPPHPAPTYAQPDRSHPEHGQARAGAPVTPAHPARPAPTKTPKKNDERSDR
jgi:hypothetical protein